MEGRGVIVLDEQLKNAGLTEAIQRWYRGRVVSITTLRPGTVIKDDVIPLLLRQVSDPIFVTINVTDFWQRTAADRHFCVACFPLTDDRAGEIPELLRRLLQLPEFRTKRERQGKVIRASQTQVQYYPHDGRIRTLSW